MAAYTLDGVYDATVRAAAAQHRAQGPTTSEISRALGVSRATVRSWEGEALASARLQCCPACDGATLDESAYAALLGFYLGDGCISQAARYFALRVSCDAPRWQFTNESADIRELCCWVLDLVDIAWRKSGRNVISVSRRAAVQRLDDLIGLES